MSPLGNLIMIKLLAMQVFIVQKASQMDSLLVILVPWASCALKVPKFH